MDSNVHLTKDEQSRMMLNVETSLLPVRDKIAERTTKIPEDICLIGFVAVFEIPTTQNANNGVIVIRHNDKNIVIRRVFGTFHLAIDGKEDILRMICNQIGSD